MSFHLMRRPGGWLVAGWFAFGLWPGHLIAQTSGSESPSVAGTAAYREDRILIQRKARVSPSALADFHASHRGEVLRSFEGLGRLQVVRVPAGETVQSLVAKYQQSGMVAFAEMSASDPPPDSILRLFQPDSIESSLTDWDMAFLKSLYRMPLDRRSRIQRGHLVEALLDERLPKKGAAKKP